MFKTTSPAMRFFQSVGLEGIAWSLRRLHCPVSSDALVLDVGSGGNPYPRANVLLDAYEDTVERYNAPIIKDRPMVYGMGERIPFRDKVFDFVIASHVLEHTADPDLFLNELMRVGKAGYIETPDAFFERINPFRFHRLEVTDVDGKIIIFKKSEWRPHGEWVDMYERKVKDSQFIRYLKKHPAPFYMRFYWQNEIDYEIQNPEIDASWAMLSGITSTHANTSLFMRLRVQFTKFIRKQFSQTLRNSSIDLLSLLRCPDCFSTTLTQSDSTITCQHCGTTFISSNGVPVMYPQGKQS
jgi:SAM-dependent methyltransferase